MGFEPTTPTLARLCSTPELRPHHIFTSSSPEFEIWSGRWDSNPRPQPWQGCALPLSYARMLSVGGLCPKADSDAIPLPHFIFLF